MTSSHQSLITSFPNKNIPHPLEKRPQIPTGVQPLHTPLNPSLLNPRPIRHNPVLLPLRIKLKPGLPLPLPFVHTAEHEFQPIRLSRPLNPHPQVRFPEIELWFIQATLRVEVAGVGGLCGLALGDLFLEHFNFGAEGVTVGGVGVALVRYGGDGGLHFGGFSGLCGEG